MKFNLIDFFGAPGGLALGFRMTNRYNILVCVDNDARAAATYRANFPETEVIEDPIESVVPRNLLDVAQIKRDEIDLVTGGPPCPGFSIIGRVKIASLAGTGRWKNLNKTQPRFINDQRNVLYKYFLRLVKGLRPKFFVMENVFGMISHNNGGTVRQVLKDFGTIGYRTSWKLLNAVEYGVPQERRRIFFIGNTLGLPNPFPAPTHRSPTGGNPGGEKLEDPVAVWDAIGDLPRLRSGEGKELSSYRRKPLTDYQRWARRHNRHLFNHVARWHSKRDLKLFGHMREGMKWKDLPPKLKKLYGYRDDIFSDKMKRLWRGRPSWTVVAHLAKDGYMYIHPTQDRTLTVREAARLQSFPDRFRFMGSRTGQFKQVGNAVPPLLAGAMADEIRRILERAP